MRDPILRSCKILLLSLLMLFTLFVLPTQARPNLGGSYPPFGATTITGAFGEDRGSYLHEGLDLGLGDWSDVVAPFRGTATLYEGGGYGHYVYFQISSDVDPDRGIIIFGDVSGAEGHTYLPLDTPTEVEPGTRIAQIFGYPSNASGPHLHMEYWPQGLYKGGPIGSYYGPENPVLLLSQLGTIVSGDPGGFSSESKESPGMKWGIEGLTNLGSSFNFVLKTFIEAANNAAKYLKPYAMSLLLSLCLLDLTFPILLSGMAFSFNTLVWKIIRYSGIIGVILYWPKFINDILLNFVTSMAGVSTGAADMIAENISQPQLILQKAMFLISPAFNKFSNFNYYDLLSNAGSVFAIYLLSALVIFFFCLLAFYMTLTLAEFYLSAGLNLITLPFAAWNMTKFATEGTLGHLISSALRLLLVSFTTFLMVSAIQSAKPTDIFSATLHSEVITGAAPAPETAFNSPYIGPARDIAAANNIPPALFLALISTESSWDPNNSPDPDWYGDPSNGEVAYGLGQLMGETGKQYGLSSYEDRADPIANLNASARYFAHLHDVFGNWDYALAAYNSGEYAIDAAAGLKSWQKAYVNQVRSNLNGSYGVENNISTEQLIKFTKLCIAAIFLSILARVVPKRLMRVLSGPVQLPGK